MSWERIEDAAVQALATGLVANEDGTEVGLMLQVDTVVVVMDMETALALVEGIASLFPTLAAGKLPKGFTGLTFDEEDKEAIEKSVRKNRKRLGLPKP